MIRFFVTLIGAVALMNFLMDKLNAPFWYALPVTAGVSLIGLIFTEYLIDRYELRKVLRQDEKKRKDNSACI